MVNCELTPLAASAILEEGHIHPSDVSDTEASFMTAQGYVVEISVADGKLKYMLYEKIK